jgi:Zn-dependent protease
VHISQLTVIYFCALVAAIILHEISHGVVALFFGDDTARRAGRLTLNPLPHIDPVGSIIMPAIGALSGIPVIGWAKPVPVNPNRLRNQRRDMLIVSLAGPTTNLVLMFASALVARSLYRPLFGIRGLVIISEQPLTVQIAWAFAVVNLFLGLFNLLPIPPLDGAALLERVLPRDWLPRWHAFQPYGVLVLLVLVLWGGTGKVLDPFLQHLNSYIFR